MNEIDRLLFMTKFAIYDSTTGKEDRKMNEYFLNDYVYAKNCQTRILAFLGCVIVLFFYWLHRIAIEKIDIFAIDYKQAFFEAVAFIVIVLALYTVIGTIKAASEYTKAQNRLRRYFNLLNRLDRSVAKEHAEEASNDGADFAS